MQRRWVALAAACLMAAGCGGGAEGKAIAAAPVEEFEPCSTPAEAIEATGLNPDILGNGWGEGIQADGWTRCLWESADRAPW